MNKFAHFLRRTITVFAGMLLAALGTLIAIVAAGLVSPVRLEWYGISLNFDTGQLPFLSTLGWVGIGVGVTLLGVLLLMLGFMRERKQKQIVVSGALTNGVASPGQVTVSAKSIEALATYVVERIEGVREAMPTVKLKKDGWHIECPVAMSADSAVPDASALVKDALRESLERHTGIPVARVNVGTQLNAIQADRRVVR